MHPHGVLSLHAWCSFCTEACGYTQKFPGIDLHVGRQISICCQLQSSVHEQYDVASLVQHFAVSGACAD